MLQRQKTEGVSSFVRTTSTPQGELMLDRVFVELEDGMAEWARGGDANVILFDPTYNTNKFGFKLCPFVTHPKSRVADF